MAQLYLSTTVGDLEAFRDLAQQLLEQRRYDVVIHDEDSSKQNEKYFKERIAGSDLFIGVYAWRYGRVLINETISQIEAEYNHAVKKKIDVLIFLLHEDALWPRSQMDTGELGMRVEVLRQKLSRSEKVVFFYDLEDFREKLSTETDIWAQKRLSEKMDSLRGERDQEISQESLKGRRVVNLRPLDVLHTFQDREQEVADLRSYLARDNIRMISIVGRGGMGKTALASRILGELEEGRLKISDTLEIPVDGILYLSTRSTGINLERIYNDVGRMLGEPTRGQLAEHWLNTNLSVHEKISYVLEKLRHGHYLFLLDNLEDELDDEGRIKNADLRAFIERCITHPSGAKLVITSREDPRIELSELYSSRSILLRYGLPKDKAISLIKELDPQNQYGIHDASEEELEDAYGITQGIPRAIEILVGILHRDKALNIHRLLENKKHYGAEVVERLVADGYLTLTFEEQLVMQALAIFNVPIKETAIEYLLNPWYPGIDVALNLSRLVNSYFVGTSRLSGTYSLHPLDRDYVYKIIPQSEQEDDGYNVTALELRASEFYRSLGSNKENWKQLEYIAPKLSEFEHRISGKDIAGALTVLEEIDFDYLYQWGYASRLVTLRTKLQGVLRAPKLSALNYLGLGRSYRALGQDDVAIDAYEKALALSRSENDTKSEIEVLSRLGIVYRTLGQIEQAIGLQQQALLVAQQIGDRKLEGTHLGNLGLAFHNIGKIDEAIEYHKLAIEASESVSDVVRVGSWTGNLGLAYRDLGLFEKAFDQFQKALEIALSKNNSRRVGIWNDNLGRVSRDMGKFAEAIEYHKTAVRVAHEIENKLGLSHSAAKYGKTLMLLGYFEDARSKLDQAFGLNIPETKHRIALDMAILSLITHNSDSNDRFTAAVDICKQRLVTTSSLFEEQYTLAIAMLGQTLTDVHWRSADEQARENLLSPIRLEFHKAIELCSGAGIIHDVLRDILLINSITDDASVREIYKLLENSVVEVPRIYILVNSKQNAAIGETSKIWGIEGQTKSAPPAPGDKDTTFSSIPTGEHVTDFEYNLDNIRQLLINGFTEVQLRTYCLSDRHFKELGPYLSERDSLAEIAGKIIVFADKQHLVDTLLKWAKRTNPKQYNQYQPYKVAYTESDMTDPVSTSAALIVLNNASGFLFNQVSEYLKEWRNRRKGDAPPPSAIVPSSTIASGEELIETFSARVSEWEKSAQLRRYRSQILELEALQTQIENLHRNYLLYSEAASDLPSTDDAIRIRVRQEGIQDEMAGKAKRMREILEQLSQREIQVAVLDR